MVSSSLLFSQLCRPRITQLESLKAKIICEVEAFSKESSALEESERELEILLAEKKLHEEAIAALNVDIHELTQGIVVAKREQEVIRARTTEMINEIKPLKREVDEVRASIGLESIQDPIKEADVIFKKK